MSEKRSNNTIINSFIRKNIFIPFIAVLCSFPVFGETPVDYVNPLMGSLSKMELSTGNTYPAIAVPWGMNFWTPQTGRMGNGWAYVYTDDKIRGLKQTHQPSPWINDYGQFSIMPVVGGNKINEDDRASWFSHKAEIATPYYYSVYLADHDVKAELSPTERAAIFRFTFPQADSAYIVLDAFDKGSYVKLIPEKRQIIGYSTKNSGGVPEGFKNYFVLEFDIPFRTSHVWNNAKIVDDENELAGEHVGAVVGFQTKRGQLIHVKVASSFISYDQALLNLKEIGNNTFEKVQENARNKWNNVLGRITVEGGSIDEYRTFYSCLYRCLLFPRKFYEINGINEIVHYSPYNGEIRPGYFYTDTGFWDTFRALFPLLNLIYPSVNEEIQEGMANIARENKFLPEWASPGHRDCMIGNNSASVVADAFLKGVGTKNAELLYNTIVYGTTRVHPTVSSAGRLGHEYYNTLGYVPYDVNIRENTARTLEYAYDDWCIMQLAKKLKRPESEIDLYAKRCQNYKNVFDASHKLMRGKNKDGKFQSPFNPYKWGDAFTEGNSWHYTWSVFHDVQGLINLMGGESSFISMLDSVFVVPPIYDDSYYGTCIHEIREMQIMNMGNYAHGNQPIQHMIYLYNYAGQPWKAQYWTREVMDKLYQATPDGYCGDEDNGQTSAWYVFSALGFYPVCPASDEYVLGSPLFKRVRLKLENGKEVVISADNNSKKNRYIAGMHLNQKEYTRNFITYDELKNGCTINFNMSGSPQKQRGTNPSDYPYSFSNEQKNRK